MKLHELLTEAKAKMRDTKGTRDKAVDWVLKQGEPFIDKVAKDASVMNGLVATLAKVAGKKMTGGKYSLTDADFRKIAQANFTVHNLGKTTFKKITSFAGGGKPHTSTKATPKKSAPEPSSKGVFQMECWDCGETWENPWKQATCPNCGSGEVSNVWLD